MSEDISVGSVFSNKLTDAERERLVLLMEECGEVVQIAAKVLRHGYESLNPNIMASLPNRENLTKEIGDVFFAVELMIRGGDFSHSKVTEAMKVKARKIKPYLHYQDGLV